MMLQRRKITKKAILMPETLKILIAVVCIVLLVYLAFKLYTVMSRSSEYQKAKFSVEAIVGKLDVLTAGNSLEYLYTPSRERNSKGFDIFWVLIAPANENKLCICPEATLLEDQLEKCQGHGACKDVEYKIEINSACGNMPNCFKTEEAIMSLTLINNGANRKIAVSEIYLQQKAIETENARKEAILKDAMGNITTNSMTSFEISYLIKAIEDDKILNLKESEITKAHIQSTRKAVNDSFNGKLTSGFLWQLDINQDSKNINLTSNSTNLLSFHYFKLDKDITPAEGSFKDHDGKDYTLKLRAAYDYFDEEAFELATAVP
jgi:hypothetical protein